MSIKTKCDVLRNTRNKASKALEELMTSCTHPANKLDRLAAANTGNYCPQDDCYWYEFHCHDCGKKWHEDQDKRPRRKARPDLKKVVTYE
jgi:hypothetical protein